MIENTAAFTATIVVYMGVCLLPGFIAWKRTSTLGDFILGGRSLNSWVTAFSAQATDMSRDLARESRNGAGAAPGWPAGLRRLPCP